MKKQVLTTFLALLGLSTSGIAQSLKPSNSPQSTLSTFQQELVFADGSTVQMNNSANAQNCFVVTPPSTPMRVHNALNKATMHKVTLKFKPVNNSINDNITVYNKQVGQLNFRYDAKNPSKPLVAELPEGKYSMLAIYRRSTGGLSFVFREDIQVGGDMEVEFDEAQATNPLSFTVYNPNGEEFHADIREGGKVTTPKNYDIVTSGTYIVDKTYGNVSIIQGGIFRPKGEPDYYTSKTSNNIVLGRSYFIGKAEKWYFVKLEGQMNKTSHYENAAKNYQVLTQAFMPSPHEGDLANNHTKGYYIWNVAMGQLVSRAGGTNTRYTLPDNKMTIYLDVTNTENDAFQAFVSPRFADSRKVDNNKAQYKYTIAAPVYILNGKLKYVASGYDLYSGLRINEKTFKPQFAPYNEAFSFEANKAYVFGDNCPINSIQFYLNGKSIAPKFTYVGMYGEVRESDLEMFIPDQTVEGSVLKGIITNPNVTVDGFDGSNTTIFTLNTKNSDLYPPVLQALRFVNNEGVITNRFENINDITLQFAAADFKAMQNDKRLRYFEYVGKPKVELFFAPYGTENWVSFVATEDKSKFFLPQYGNYFTAKPGSVKTETKIEGWQKLKVVLTDDAGNTQEQIISPAFRLPGKTSITNIVLQMPFVIDGSLLKATNNTVSAITIFATNGTVVATSTTNTLSLENLPHATYIVSLSLGNNTTSATKIVW